MNLQLPWDPYRTQREEAERLGGILPLAALG